MRGTRAAKEAPIVTSDSNASEDAWAHNARLGLILFAIYGAFYGGFIVIVAFMPDVMRTIAVAGVNLAVVYGIALIIGAFLLSLLYMVLCKREPQSGPDWSDLQVSEKAVEEEGAA